MNESILKDRGIRLSIEAEKALNEYRGDIEKLISKLVEQNHFIVEKEHIKQLIEELEEKKEDKLPEPIIIERSDNFSSIAKEIESNIEIKKERDITGKSRTTGKVEDFINYFRKRYEKLSSILRERASRYSGIEVKDWKKHINENVKVIVMVTDKRITKTGNIVVEVEDLSGSMTIVFSKKIQRSYEMAKLLLKDEVVSIEGKITNTFMFGNEIHWPDIPVIKEQKKNERDVAIVYLSDLHFGSRYFLEECMERFLSWISGKGEKKELAKKVKYILVAGDVVDGIGIYPKQEKELVVKDISKQYSLFDDFVNQIPDYIEVIVGPGNHDAVRRAEPQPAIPKDLITSRAICVGNPAFVRIEDLEHIIYHGTSMDSLISNLKGLTYSRPEEVMKEMLKRRHLSPLYGDNPIIPEQTDYLIIEEVPDVVHCGHLHKNGAATYRSALLLNSGTFQSRTEFQIKQGHVPTPGLVYIYETKYGALSSIDLGGG